MLKNYLFFVYALSTPLCASEAVNRLFLTARKYQNHPDLFCNVCGKCTYKDQQKRLLLLPDSFPGIAGMVEDHGATEEAGNPQKSGNSPGPGPEVVERKRIAKESVAGRCRIK